MELFERVVMTKNFLGSKSAVARALGIIPQKLDNYCNPDSQKNLWPLLPLLLKAIPNLSREWLYFGEGEILLDSNGSAVDKVGGCTLVKPLAELVAQQQETIRQLSETNQKLVEELLKKNLKGDEK